MWCPECGDEYRESFTTCPDCDIDLVTVRPARPLAVDTVAHVEYDLRGWSEEQRSTLDQWLQSSRIPAEWQPPGLLAVTRERRADVEALVDALSWGAHDESGAHPPVVVHSAPLAGPGRRLLGAWVDRIVVGVAAVLVAGVWGRSVTSWVATIALASLYDIVGVACWGRTVGKLVVGTRVERLDGVAPPGWGTATIRWLVPALALIPQLAGGTAVLLGLAWTLAVYLPILGPERRGLHDRAAGTIVVRV